jgi:hypothetical protein
VALNRPEEPTLPLISGLKSSDAKSGASSFKTRCVYSRTISVFDRTAVSLAMDASFVEEPVRPAADGGRGGDRYQVENKCTEGRIK